MTGKPGAEGPPGVPAGAAAWRPSARRLAPVKAFQALLIAGGVVVIVGLSLVLGAFDSGQQSNLASIPAGHGWYSFIELNLGDGGVVSGAYTELTGRSVDFCVLDESQYATYTTRVSPPAFAARTIVLTASSALGCRRRGSTIWRWTTGPAAKT